MIQVARGLIKCTRLVEVKWKLDVFVVSASLSPCRQFSSVLLYTHEKIEVSRTSRDLCWRLKHTQ